MSRAAACFVWAPPLEVTYAGAPAGHRQQPARNHGNRPALHCSRVGACGRGIGASGSQVGHSLHVGSGRTAPASHGDRDPHQSSHRLAGLIIRKLAKARGRGRSRMARVSRCVRPIVLNCIVFYYVTFLEPRCGLLSPSPPFHYGQLGFEIEAELQLDALALESTRSGCCGRLPGDAYFSTLSFLCRTRTNI